MGQVVLDDRAYLVRWEYSYSSWTLFTCEIEMLLHVVSTAGEVCSGKCDCGEENWPCLDLEDKQNLKIKLKTIQTGLSVMFIWASETTQ